MPIGTLTLSLAELRQPLDLHGVAQTNRDAGLRYRLIVIAPTVADAARHAGGWIIDRVLAGFDAVLLTTAMPDDLMLRVLGARTVDLRQALAGPHWHWAQEIAVQGPLYRSDPQIRLFIDKALSRWPCDVRVWGDVRRGDSREHHLSIAAQAFKAHALRLGDGEHDIAGIGRVESFGTVARKP